MNDDARVSKFTETSFFVLHAISVPCSLILSIICVVYGNIRVRLISLFPLVISLSLIVALCVALLLRFWRGSFTVISFF